jgi:hypothetical protein
MDDSRKEDQTQMARAKATARMVQVRAQNRNMTPKAVARTISTARGKGDDKKANVKGWTCNRNYFARNCSRRTVHANDGNTAEGSSSSASPAALSGFAQTNVIEIAGLPALETATFGLICGE